MRSIIYPAEVFLKSTVLTKRMGLLAVVLGTIGTGAAAPCSATEEALQKSEMGVDTTLTNYPHTLFDSNVPHATDHARAVRTVQAYAAWERGLGVDGADAAILTAVVRDLDLTLKLSFAKNTDSTIPTEILIEVSTLGGAFNLFSDVQGLSLGMTDRSVVMEVDIESAKLSAGAVLIAIAGSEREQTEVLSTLLKADFVSLDVQFSYALIRIVVPIDAAGSQILAKVLS